MAYIEFVEEGRLYRAEITPGYPGIYSGPPDNWEEGTPTEVESVDVFIDPKWIPVSEVEQDFQPFYDLAAEKWEEKVGDPWLGYEYDYE
jgi:hypothetical protein